MHTLMQTHLIAKLIINQSLALLFCQRSLKGVEKFLLNETLELR